MPKTDYIKSGTMESEQRGLKWPPHKAISKVVDYDTDLVHLQCVNCGAKWTKTRAALLARDFTGQHKTCKQRDLADD